MKFGIIFGSNSYEHEISIVSAIVIKKVLKSELEFIFIDKDRNFYLIDNENMKASYFSSGEYKKAKKLHLIQGGFALHGMLKMKLLDVDCYVNLVHGADGEDGKLAGMFEFFELNFIGPRLEASVMSFNKVLTKFLALKCDVPTLPYEIIKLGQKPKMDYPFILKPARLGSSIGVKIVNKEEELDYALDVAFEFDNEVLVEPFIKGVREFNLAGFKGDDGINLSKIEEPTKEDYLDFKQKYEAFGGESVVKFANLEPKLEKEVKDNFIKIYENGAFDGALIRCDFFEIDGKIYLNEINPNPGSLANYLFEDFTATMIKLASSLKTARKIPVRYDFINNITKGKGNQSF